MDRFVEAVILAHESLSEGFSVRLRKRLRRVAMTLTPIFRGIIFLAIFASALAWILDSSRLSRRHKVASAIVGAPIIILACAPLTTACLNLARRRSLRRRRRADQCLRCGYQMHGTVTGTCPECGRHFVPARSIALQHTIEAALPLLKPHPPRRNAS
jgi:hypothetical protein